MEEQHERHNPVNPKSELMTNYTGMGATPSMGLSQYRGGALQHLDLPGMKGSKRVGRGKKPSEAHQMGQQLSKHIHELHGAGFWSDFGDGFKKGFTGTLDALRPVSSLIPGFNETADAGRSIVGWGQTEQQRAGEQLSLKKAGRSRNNGVPLLSGLMAGGSNTGAYEGHGYGEDGHGQQKGSGLLGQNGQGQQKQKRMVGAGTKARASLVKKVMAEHGCNMIEASKYIKQHNLSYK